MGPWRDPISESERFAVGASRRFDTTNWTDVPTTPTLTNVQHRVIVPLAASERFYRLKR